MPITTAQLKTAIEAKIAAASGSTSLEDLTLIKNNADTWLANNSGGTITGYASLETLIQTKQNALTGSSTLDDITLTSASVFPPQSDRVPVALSFTTSQTYTVPANCYLIRRLAITGGGGAGGGGNAGGASGGGGAGANTIILKNIAVIPGDVLTIVIGAGGVGALSAQGGAGGASYVLLNGRVIVQALGGSGGGLSTGGISPEQPQLEMAFKGGNGSEGRNNSGSSQPGGKIYVMSSGSIFADGPASLGANGGSVRFAGGAGGSSYYGAGANAVAGSPSNGPAIAGLNAPSSSYGAGGSGATGGTDFPNAAGGNGAPGFVEVVL